MAINRWNKIGKGFESICNKRSRRIRVTGSGKIDAVQHGRWMHHQPYVTDVQTRVVRMCVVKTHVEPGAGICSGRQPWDFIVATTSGCLAVICEPFTSSAMNYWRAYRKSESLAIPLPGVERSTAVEAAVETNS